MFHKRIRILLGAAVLLAALLPMQFSVAMQNSQTGRPECPPIDASMLRVPDYIKSLPPYCRGANAAGTLLSTQTLPLTTGGPDDFGYTFDDTVAFNWISAANASGVTGDESYSQPPFDIGFNFPYYGLQHSQLLIHTNGFLTFDPIITCCFWTSSPIPNAALPNNYIAPFWDDLVVGESYNSGGIYYERGGVAPDRFLVVEWRDVTTYLGSDPFSFEVILYENGDIVAQIQSLPSQYISTVGIENNLGDDGLAYHHGNTGVSAPKAIQFVHPTGPIARVSVSPRDTAQFASTNTNTNFAINVSNPGSAGTDTYNLFTTSSWAVNLYQDGCVTPLVDTNADTVIDTGPVPEGASTTICVSFTTPAGAVVADGNSASMIVASSLDPIKTRDVSMKMVISAPFVQVLEDYENAANAFQINGPAGPSTSYVTDDFYFANGLATMRLPDGRYIYAWRKPQGNLPDSHSNIEFTILQEDGSFSLPVTQLTNNLGSQRTYDYDPAVAVAPNGNIAFTWRRWVVDNNTQQSNFNMFFAMISDTGMMLYSPTNITNNNLWDDFDNLDVPHFFNPAIAATSDNRFVLSWEDYRTDSGIVSGSDIWIAVRHFDGNEVTAPVAFTTNSRSFDPVLNPLTGDNVILTFTDFNQFPAPYFAVIRSDGTTSKPATPLGGLPNIYPFDTPDAVVTQNGNVAVVWPTVSGVALDILDASTYDVTSGPLFAGGTQVPFRNFALSLTYDTSEHIIMTWAAGDGDSPLSMFYALADSTGTFITDPMAVRFSPIGILLSQNGQGNAPIIAEPPAMDVDIDVVPGSAANIVNLKSTSVQVAILSSAGFNALTDVNRSSLTFGKTGNESSLISCLKGGRDVNLDGRLDLVCNFRVRLTGLVVGDAVAILRGSTVAGLPFEASDSVTVIRGPK